MVGGGAFGGQGVVRREQLRPVAAQPQRGCGDRQLGHAGIGRGVGERSRVAGAQRLQVAGADVEVDRAPVVGVDQALLPQLAALVDVRHAGHGDRQELGRERVAPARSRDSCHQVLDYLGRRRLVERGVDSSVYGGLVVLVRLGPGGPVAGLAHRLLGVAVQPGPQVGVGRPGADDRLPEQAAESRVRHRCELEQLLQRRLPDVG